MKKIFFFIAFLSFTAALISQDITVGGRLSVGLQDNDIGSQLGPGLALQYSMPSIPLSVEGKVNYYYSNDLGNFNYGISLQYYPVKWDIEPFAGAGIYHNSYSNIGSDMPDYINGRMTAGKRIDDSYSYEIITGVKFAAQSFINFIVEVDYIINKTDYEIIFNYPEQEIVKDEYNFNSIFLRLGLMFRI